MAARNAAKTPSRKARVLVAKAISLGASDGQLLAGTVADANRQATPDAELYHLLYTKHPWVRSCVRLIGNAVAQEGFAVGEIDGDDMQPIDDKDPRGLEIHEFFRNAFRPKTSRQAIKAVAIDLMVYGVAYWRKKYTGELLTNLERLDPRLIVPKLNTDGTAIDHFEVQRQQPTGNTAAGMGVPVAVGTVKELSAKEVVMFSLDEGGDTVLGSPSPLEALDLTTAMDLNIRIHRNSFFKNGATLGNVFINKEADEDGFRQAVKEIQSMYVGAANAYKNIAIAGDWDIKSLMQSGKQELDFVKSTEIVRDEICAVYSVPVAKLMSVSGAMGQSGKGEDDETFEQECVLPIEELIYETMTSDILDGELEIADLELVPRRRNALRLERIQSAVQLVRCGGTGNEARSIIGLAPSDQDGMDTPLFIGATALGVQSDEATAANADTGNATEATAAQDKNEVAKKAQSRFRY